MDHCKSFLSALIGFICSCVLSVVHASSMSSPIGYWKIIDDLTGKPKSIVQIWKTNDQLLMGKVVKIFSPLGHHYSSFICTHCSGLQHNQPVVGMLVLNGLKAKDHQWEEGSILDTDNGRTYSCALRLSDNGKKLKVQGYIGLPLFGRSQIWERVDLMSG